MFKISYIRLLICGLGSSLFLSISLNSQTNVLEKYIQIGVANNLQVQKNALAVDKQQYKIVEAKGNRLPIITFEPSYLLAAGGRRLDFPIGDLFNPAYQALNDLTQTNSFPTDLENVDEQLTPNNFLDTRFFASYPLFNPAIYYNLKAQEQLITVEQAKIEAYKIELTKNIKTAYYNYLKTFEVLEIFESSEALLDQLYRFNQKLVKYDKATPDILAGVTFEKEQINSQRASLLQQQEMAKTYFNALLNRDFNETIEKADVLGKAITQSQSLLDLRNKAVNNRPELDQINNAMKATQLVTQIEEKSLLPTVGLQASAGYQGFVNQFDVDQLLGTIAIGAQWTLYDGKKRKQKIEQSKIETLELQKDYAMVKQQIELQVIGAYHALNAARQKVVAEQAAVNSAQERFNLIKKRYENEKAILIEYLDAQTSLTNARINWSIAQYDVLIRQAELAGAIAY